MSKFPMVFLALALGSCSNQATSDKDEDRTPEASAPRAEPQNLLSDTDFIRVCRGGASFRNGTSVARIKARKINENIVQISYTRDDGKFFVYDCMTEGNVVRFRMIDESGPGTGPGAWSGRGSKTTFELKPKEIEFKDDFFDGSIDQNRVKI